MERGREIGTEQGDTKREYMERGIELGESKEILRESRWREG